MDFCECMITQKPDGSMECNQCHLDIYLCECKNLKHSLFCPDNPNRKKLDKEMGRT